MLAVEGKRLLSIRFHVYHVLKYDTIKMVFSGFLTVAGSLLMTGFTSYLLTHLHHLQIAAVVSLAIIFFATILFSYLNDVRLKNIMIQWQAEMLPNVWQHLLSLPYQIIARYQSGDLAQRFYDYETAVTQSVTLFLQMILSLAVLLFMSFYLLYCSPQLAFMLLIVTCFLHTLKVIMIPINTHYTSAGLVQKSKLMQFMQELLLQLHKIRTSCAENDRAAALACAIYRDETIRTESI